MVSFVVRMKYINLLFVVCGFLGIYYLGVVFVLCRYGKKFLKDVKVFVGVFVGFLVVFVLLIVLEKIEVIK